MELRLRFDHSTTRVFAGLTGDVASKTPRRTEVGGGGVGWAQVQFFTTKLCSLRIKRDER